MDVGYGNKTIQKDFNGRYKKIKARPTELPQCGKQEHTAERVQVFCWGTERWLVSREEQSSVLDNH